MRVVPVMPGNNNSSSFDQINFKKATIDKSVETFIEQQVKNGLAYAKSQQRKMTKRQVKNCEANIRDGWYKAYSTLEKKANQMSDGIEISVRKTERNIFDVLLAKNTETGEYADLAALVELKGVKSHNIGRDKFHWLVEKIDPKRVNEKLDPDAYRHRFDWRW